MSRKTIDFGEHLDRYIDLAVKQGGYKTEAEYLRYLVRKDEERNRAFLITKADIQEGLESGTSPKIRTSEEIVTFAKKRALRKTDVKPHG
ncbi:putative addiction module antidote protein, CC2985 family [Cyclobacterium lianum]|uniref:Putative addiction module antidote protein, CC2985 family n=1 Tax=Cyclobacterium lianum TaxID=388280 RepID=A0A1M7NYX8_9BACT|nr:type II toxin-antitoxin system ParD family antitoxin [Cyclobacterium lianum]SHN09284.1 putative addiction module antidote protein, CC2985 family [Cyclobacterium lianum]